MIRAVQTRREDKGHGELADIIGKPVSMRISLLTRSVFCSVFLISASLARTQTLAPPENVRAFKLATETLVVWDPSEGAAHYQVFGTEADMRWRYLDLHVPSNSYRDSFLSLPAYYHVGVVSPTGERKAATNILHVNNTAVVFPRIISANVHMVNAATAAIRWETDISTAAWGQVEVGPDLNSLQVVVPSHPALMFSHEAVVTGLMPDSEYWFRLTSATVDGAAVSYVHRFVATFVDRPAVTISLPLQPGSPGLTTVEDQPVAFSLTYDPPLSDEAVFELSTFSGAISGEWPDFVFWPVRDREGSGDGGISYKVDTGDFIDHRVIPVNVLRVNDPPIVHDNTIVTPEDAAGRRIEDFMRPFDMDSAGWQGLPAIVTGPTNGTLLERSIGGFNEFFYTPNTNFVGIDHIKYTAIDQYPGGSAGNIATLRIRVTPVSDPPTAQPVTAETIENTSVVITLAGNDVDGDRLMYSFQDGPWHGWLSDLPAHPETTVRYIPHAGFMGTDTFKYVVSDQLRQATGTVTVTVRPANEPPSALAASVATEFEVPAQMMLSGFDPEGESLTFDVVSGPANGILSGTGANRTYVPNPGFSGNDEFMFIVSDGRASSTGAIVSIHVSGADAVPFGPTGLVATPTANWRIQLTWADNSMREEGFVVERSTDDVTYRQITRLQANVGTFVDTGLQKNRAYFYRVSAFNANGVSQPSNASPATPMK